MLRARFKINSQFGPPSKLISMRALRRGFEFTPDFAGRSSGRLDSQLEAAAHQVGVAIDHVQRGAGPVCQALQHEQ